MDQLNAKRKNKRNKKRRRIMNKIRKMYLSSKISQKVMTKIQISDNFREIQDLIWNINLMKL